MNVRRVRALAFALIAVACSSPHTSRSQDREKASLNPEVSKSLTDREKNDLRGPVRSVAEENTSAAWTDSEGKVYPESKSWRKTEYDRTGRIVELRFRGTSGEWVTRYSYGPGDQLMRKLVQDEAGKQEREIIYGYDERGRLHSISDSKTPNNPIAFHYDENGKKTKIAIAQPIKELQGLGAISRSMEVSFEDAGSAASLPDGGSAITLYDEHDRRTEVQVHNANGEPVSRMVRIYNDQGRVEEERETVDDPLKMLARADQKKILESVDSSPQELRDRLQQFLGSSEISSTKYTYDAQGRKSKSIQKIFNHIEMEVEMAYNEHGDVAKETNKSTTRGTPDEEHDGTGSSETIYSYEYDSYGNWTVKKSASRSLPDGTFKDAGEGLRRTIEYF